VKKKIVHNLHIFLHPYPASISVEKDPPGSWSVF